VLFISEANGDALRPIGPQLLDQPVVGGSARCCPACRPAPPAPARRNSSHLRPRVSPSSAARIYCTAVCAVNDGTGARIPAARVPSSSA
jgi:hypothetical protein